MKTYSPDQVIVTFGAHVVTGFADGSFVKLARNEDAYSLVVGIDGEGTRAKVNNKSGQCELTLLQSSDSNDYLTSVAITDEQNNGGLQPLTVKDLSGRTLAFAEQAYIKKISDVEFAREVGNRVWVLETDSLVLNVAGN